MDILKIIIRKIIKYAFNNFVYIDKNSTVGHNTFIGEYSRITKTKIGNYCSIAPNVTIGPGEHNYQDLSTSTEFISDNERYNYLTSKETVIENDVWIGANAVILRGVKLGNGSVIAAGAIVTTDVDAYCIVGGIPAKFIKKRFDDEKIEKLLLSEWWNYKLQEAKVLLDDLKNA